MSSKRGTEIRLLASARNEAARLSHEYVGTLHLMVAAVADGRGRGARWLKAVGTSRERLRAAVEAVMPSFAKQPGAVNSGNLLPMSPLAQKVVAAARHSSEPEDLALLGFLLTPSDGNVANVLARVGLSLKYARQAVRKLARA